MEEHQAASFQDEAHWHCTKLKVKHDNRNRGGKFKDLLEENVIQFLLLFYVAFSEIIPNFTIKEDTVDEEGVSEYFCHCKEVFTKANFM